MNDEFKNYRQLSEHMDESVIILENLLKHLKNESAALLTTYMNEGVNAVVLKGKIDKSTIDVNELINNLKKCQEEQSKLTSKIENDLYNNLITKFTPEFNDKIVDKLISNGFNKFEAKLNEVSKSSNDLIQELTNLQNDYIKNKDEILSSVGVIISTFNDTKKEFEEDYERLKKDFRSTANKHERILIEYQKDINKQLKNEFKKTRVLQNIFIISSSIFFGMSIMYFSFPSLHRFLINNFF